MNRDASLNQNQQNTDCEAMNSIQCEQCSLVMKQKNQGVKNECLRTYAFCMIQTVEDQKQPEDNEPTMVTTCHSWTGQMKPKSLQEKLPTEIKKFWIVRRVLSMFCQNKNSVLSLDAVFCLIDVTELFSSETAPCQKRLNSNSSHGNVI